MDLATDAHTPRADQLRVFPPELAHHKQQLHEHLKEHRSGLEEEAARWRLERARLEQELREMKAQHKQHRSGALALRGGERVGVAEHKNTSSEEEAARREEERDRLERSIGVTSEILKSVEQAQKLGEELSRTGVLIGTNEAVERELGNAVGGML